MRLCFVLFMLGAIAGWARPAQIILLRHGEEPPDKDAVHLSVRGAERARALVGLLGRNSKLTSNAPIAALFATQVSKHDRSHRTGETLAPLGQELRLPVQTPYSSKDFALLAEELLTNSAWKGKTVVVCWTHRTLADFAAALGVRRKPPAWKDKNYDRFYLITFGSSGARLRDLPQHLLPGDSSK